MVALSLLGGSYVLLRADLEYPRQIPEYRYEVVRAFPHDKTAFTEGLFFRDGFLYEATGLRGRSSVRKIKLETGEIVQEKKLEDQYFGEGIVAWKNQLLQLTYTSETGFVYDIDDFRLLRTFHYRGQGWSLTQDGKQIIMDDGSSKIRFWNAETLTETRELEVTDNGKPVEYLNELEWVKGEIYANVWHTDRIARINPQTGRVVGWINLAGLLPMKDALPEPEGNEQVLNGIAYDQAADRLFVTGKYWPTVFQIRVRRETKAQ